MGMTKQVHDKTGACACVGEEDAESDTVSQVPAGIEALSDKQPASTQALLFSRVSSGQHVFSILLSQAGGQLLGEEKEKRRTPAWTDRILWLPNSSIRQLSYSAASLTASDHRPVSAAFRMTVRICLIVDSMSEKLSHDLNVVWRRRTCLGCVTSYLSHAGAGVQERQGGCNH